MISESLALLALHGNLGTQTACCLALSRFWCFLEVVQQLAHVLRALFHWCESCSCHGHLESPDEDWSACRKSCPMKGRRAPELASGGFHTHLTSLMDVSASSLACSLTNQVTEQEKTELLSAFHAGRSHIVFVVNMKTTAWKQLPLQLCALAHMVEDEAVACAKRVLQLLPEVEGVLCSPCTPCLLPPCCLLLLIA